MKKIGLMMSVLAVLGILGVLGMGAQEAWAAQDICSDDSVPEELREAAGCDTEQTLVPVAARLIQVVIGIVGVLAVCVMVYGGFMYVTSTGDPGKTTRARNILLYGIIGVVVAGLAYAIVYFVSQAVGGATGSGAA